MNKEFRIGDLFDIINNPQLDKENFIFSEREKYPYFTRTENNNGIYGYVKYFDDAHLIPGNSLAVGMISMQFHYMQHDFYAGQFTKTLIPKFRGFNENLAMYFIAILNKHSEYYQSYLVRHFKEKISETVVELPVIEHSDLNHEYTVDDIDWQYMEDRIKELEEDRIKELDAYLKVTNLDDYELTDEDRKVLSLSRKSSPNETDSLETDCQNGQVRFREFKIVDIFEVKNTKCFMQSDVIFSSGNTPYVTASDRNNSIMTYIECSPEQVDKGHCIFIGGKTLTFSYQDQDFVSNDSHNLALYLKRPKTLSRYVYMYMISSLQKSLKSKYYWGDSISNRKIQKDTFTLPVTPDGEPDFDYMERYIRAIEKLTIADVVKYKDKVIDTAKKLVNCQS